MKRLKPGNKTPVFVDMDRALFVDVDETLILIQNPPPELHDECIELDHFGFAVKAIPHRRHVELVRQFKARGHAVIVWSQGGAKWALAVVKAVGLLDCVDVVMGKPDWFLDDKPATAWMRERFFLDPVTGKPVVDGGEKK